MGSGALWNTLILGGKLGWTWLPEIMPFFENLGRTIGTVHEQAVLESIYHDMPSRNFSSDLLARATEQIAMMELQGVHWGDCGKPERIADTLARLGKQPAYPPGCLAARTNRKVLNFLVRTS